MRLFSVFIPTSIVGLLIAEVFLVLAIYLASCYPTVESGLYLFLFDESGLQRVGVLVASVIAGLHFNDFYGNVRVRSRTLLAQQVCLTIGVAFLIQAGIAYLNVNWRMPRKAMLIGSAVCIVGLPLWRIFYNAVVLRVLGAERVLLVGASAALHQVAQYMIEHPELGLSPAAWVSDHSPAEIHAGYEYFGRIADLPQAVQQIRPSRLVLGLEHDEEKDIPGLLDVRRHGLRIEDVAALYETTMGRVCLSRIRPEAIPIAVRVEPGQLALNNAVSFLIALAGLLIAGPVMLVTALAVRLTSKGPVLIRQTRVGLNNGTFTLYKFRSMFADAEARTGAVWATENDPRVTPVGRWIRLFRLDELPQLFNVLRGDMAIVGPRPERPEFVKPLAEKIPLYMHRHAVKPGITGWAQVSYQYGSTVEDTVVKLEYDLYYIKNVSLSLDFLIMFHTVKTMLLTRGAY